MIKSLLQGCILNLIIQTLIFPNIRIIESNSNGRNLKVKIEISKELWEKRIYHREYNLGDNTINQMPSVDLFLNVPENPIKLSVSSVNNASIEINSSNYKYESLPLFKMQGAFIYKFKKFIHLKIYSTFRNNELEVPTEIEIDAKFNKPVGNVNFSLENNLIVSDNLFPKYKYPTQNNDDWIDFNSSYLKISFANDGIYFITKSDFDSLGINTNSINPKSFKVFYKGVEIPIFVSGEEDNVFDNADYIEFAGMKNYGGKHREISREGKPYNEYLGRYTDTTVYFLTWGGLNGKRVMVQNYKSSQDTLDYYAEILHQEKNNWFDYSMQDMVLREMPYWATNKTWIEGLQNTGTKSKSFTLKNLYTGGYVKGIIKFQDYASNIYSRAHLLTANINSLPQQDSTYIDKYQKGIVECNYPGSNFSPGETIALKLNSLPTSATLNAIANDWFELEYTKYLIGENDSLKFSFPFILEPNFYSIKLQNFSQNNYSIWKIGSEYKKFQPFIDGSFIYISDSISTNDYFFIQDENKLLKPKLKYYNRLTNLKDENIQADYILITHKKFGDMAEEYANFIASSYQVTPIVVDIEDVYNQFSFGSFNPEVIKNFLMSANNEWKNPKPKYVFLVGSATYDYYGNKNKNMNYPKTINYVPSFGASVSDNWYVIWDSTGANIPQMIIGRLAVSERDEFERYFNKHKNYLNQPYDEWNKTFLFLSGGTGDDQAQLDQLRNVNEYIINSIAAPKPIGANIHHFYKTLNPKTNFGPYPDEIVNSVFKKGALFISYIGHSGTRTWDNSITEPYQLSNDYDRYPLITDFGCSTGRFAEPDVTSFSELFTLSEEGQSIAYIGNSSLGFVSTAVSVPKIFYNHLLNDTTHNISSALISAKKDLLNQYGDNNVNRLFVLTNTYFGDPLISLKLPEKPNLRIGIEDYSVSPEVPTDNLNTLKIKANYFNLGLVTDSSFTIKAVHTYNEINDTILINEKLPLFSDSLELSYNVKNKPGMHEFSIILDLDNVIDEIYEDDNSIQFSVNVASTSFKPLLQYQSENNLYESIRILNPAMDTSKKNIIVELSKNINFNLDLITLSKRIDGVYTDIDISGLSDGRYYIRFKSDGTDEYSVPYSFYKSNEKSNYLLIDSISFSSVQLHNLKYIGDHVELDNDTTTIHVVSAGFNDGNTAVIQINGTNYIPENTLRGHHICLFDTLNMDFKGYYRFDVFGGGVEETQKYIDFLDSLSNKYWVVFAISDEGHVSNSTLRNKIKEYGSRYIDEVGFRYSWAMIGKKGLSSGEAIEAFSPASSGSVVLDTATISPFSSGYFVSNNIGKSFLFDSLYINYISTNDSSIKIFPVLNDTDTLASIFNHGKTSYSLEGYNNGKLNSLKFIVQLYRHISNDVLSINKFGVKYNLLPEITSSGRLISLSKDKIIQGDSLSLNYGFANVGESIVDSVGLVIYVVYPDNSKKLFSSEVLINVEKDSIYSNHVVFKDNYTNGYGNFAFEVHLDEENRVPELFEDNNIFRIPFEILKDTVTNLQAAKVNVLFNGQSIFENETVNSHPTIEIVVSYQPLFDYSDTTQFSVFLDGSKKYFGSFDSLQYDTINREIRYTFKPSLSPGTHSITITGRNILGNIKGESGYNLSFKVTEGLEIVDLYNYPNPMAEDTYFIFGLPELPEKLILKVFTIAGREIYSNEYDASELNFNINKIYWDGKDNDGDVIANGVYFYKMIVWKEGKSKSTIGKLAVIR